MALELALKVIKNRHPHRTKVIISTYGCRGIFDPVIRAGLQPVFADIDSELNLSGDFVRKLLERHHEAAAIVVPHLCGGAANAEGLIATARNKGLVIIEDVCQSLGAQKDGVSLGSQYDMAIFSFGLGKTITATSGGILVSRIMEEDLAQEYQHLQEEDTRIVKRRFWKILLKYFLKWDLDLNEEILNGHRYCKMHPLDAGLVTSQLKRLGEIIARQRNHARGTVVSLKRTGLNFHLQEGEGHIYTKLSLIFDDDQDRLRLQKALQQASIETEEMYTPLHTRDFAQGFFNGENLVNAEKIYKNVFNIPVRPDLSRRQVDRIKGAIANVNAGRGRS